MEFLLAALLCQETNPSDLPPLKVAPLSGPVQIVGGAVTKPQLLMKVAEITPSHLLGSSGGAAARLAIEEDLLLTLRGVKAAKDEGISAERSGDRKVRVRLHRGTLVVDCLETDIAVATDHGTAQGKGCYFLIESTADKTTVVAIDGDLKFTNDLGTVTLSGRQTVTADSRKAPEAPKVLKGADRLQWVHDFDKTSNLLQNGGFEQGLAQWYSSNGPLNGLGKLEETQSFEGRRSLRLELKTVKVTANSMSCLSQDRKKTLVPDKRYLLSCWVRTDKLTRDQAAAAIAVRVIHGSPLDTVNLTTSDFECPTADGMWRRARFVFTAKQDTCSVGLGYCKSEGTYDGTVWFDDVCLLPFPDPPEKKPDK